MNALSRSAPEPTGISVRSVAGADAHERHADRAADQVVHGNRAAAVSVPGLRRTGQMAAAVEKGPGQPLDPTSRTRLETGFGADFSTVRIHAGDRAAEAAERLGAQAYTDGEAIVFGAGQYSPRRHEGMQLLAHEAAHVLQQRAGASGVQLKPGDKPAPADYKKVEDAEKALKAKYGVAGLRNGASSWSVAELNKVYDALAKLPAGDVAALKGVTLAREKTLTADKPASTAPGEEAPKEEKVEALDGKFVTRQKIDTGATEFTDEVELQLADSAFNSAAQTEETLFHETGHAVASKARRDAFRGQLKATAKFNKRVDEQAATDSALTSAANTMNPVATDASAIANQVNDLVKQRGVAKTKADKDAIDAQIKELKKEHAELSKKLAPLKEAHKKAQAADTTAISNKDAAEKAKDTAVETADKTKAASGAHLPVQRFVDFVAEKKIPPITKYAAKHWPSEPEEFYAEAYSLYRTNPDGLKEKSTELFNWFKGGNYK
jgi:hypothetical protein